MRQHIATQAGDDRLADPPQTPTGVVRRGILQPSANEGHLVETGLDVVLAVPPEQSQLEYMTRNARQLANAPLGTRLGRKDGAIALQSGNAAQPVGDQFGMANHAQIVDGVDQHDWHIRIARLDIVEVVGQLDDAANHRATDSVGILEMEFRRIVPHHHQHIENLACQHRATMDLGNVERTQGIGELGQCFIQVLFLVTLGHIRFDGPAGRCQRGVDLLLDPFQRIQVETALVIHLDALICSKVSFHVTTRLTLKQSEQFWAELK